jgi:tetratricopeptide (TPR) repeat protein
MRKLTLSKTDPTRITYLMAPANLLIERKRYGEAVTDLSRLAAENRGAEENRELRYALADAQEKAGQYAEAEATLIKLAGEMKDTETKVRASAAVASFYERRNRPGDAIQVYKDALMIDPGSIVARTGLRRVYDNMKQPEAAAAFLESLALAGKESPDLAASASVAQYYTEENRREKYVVFARRAAVKYPKNPDALKLYAQALQHSGTGEMKPETRQEISRLYRQIADIDPKNAEAEYQIGVQQEALGNKEEAISAYKRAAALETEASGAAAMGKAKVALARLGITLPPAEPKATGAPLVPVKPTPSAAQPAVGSQK